MKQTEFLGLKIYEEDIDNVDPAAINKNMETIDRKSKEMQEAIDFLYKPWNTEEPASISPEITSLMMVSTPADKINNTGDIVIKNFTFKAKHYGQIKLSYVLETSYENNSYDAQMIIKINNEIVDTNAFPVLTKDIETKEETRSSVLNVQKGDVVEMVLRVEMIGKKDTNYGIYRRVKDATIYANGDTLFRYYADDWSY